MVNSTKKNRKQRLSPCKQKTATGQAFSNTSWKEKSKKTVNFGEKYCRKFVLYMLSCSNFYIYIFYSITLNNSNKVCVPKTHIFGVSSSLVCNTQVQYIKLNAHFGTKKWFQWNWSNFALIYRTWFTLICNPNCILATTKKNVFLRIISFQIILKRANL